jgi:hypothetical protein
VAVVFTPAYGGQWGYGHPSNRSRQTPSPEGANGNDAPSALVRTCAKQHDCRDSSAARADVFGRRLVELHDVGVRDRDRPTFRAVCQGRPPLYTMKYAAGTTPQNFGYNRNAIAFARKWAGRRARAS